MRIPKLNWRLLLVTFVTIVLAMSAACSSSKSPSDLLSPIISPAVGQMEQEKIPMPVADPIPGSLADTPSVSTSAPKIVQIVGASDTMLQLDFDAIDRHALSAPSAASSSANSLATYLVQPVMNDFERVRAIFRWVTENITYDVHADLTNTYGDPSPSGVLASGTAVCSGYAGLFAQLAREAGIEVVEISGWAKGGGYEVGERISGPVNHAWNAVKINGGWYFIEPTWGAGHVDGNQFVRHFEDFFFLTPPDEFIYTHFPEEPKWQLLEAPISKFEFESLPYLRPAFFTNGLEIDGQLQSAVSVDYQLSFNIRVADEIVIQTELEQNEQKLPRSLTFAQRSGNLFQIDAVFPSPGDYVLTVFAGNKLSADSLEGALECKIEVSEGQPGDIGFPETYGTYQQEDVYLYSPMAGYLQSGTSQYFRLTVPRAKDVAIIIGQQWHHLVRNGDTFENMIPVPKGEIKVCAVFPEEDSCWTLLTYVGI